MSPVYSTSSGRLCPACGKPVTACICRQRNASTVRAGHADGMVRLRRETKGRKGKGVTLVDGLALSDDDIRTLAKTLKACCGSGGTVKDGIIEIQGDHRQTIKEQLDARGIRSKFAGG